MPKQNEKTPRWRKPGRPRRTAEERASAQERRIAPSFEGRLKFRPGDPHVLNVEVKEARNYRALLVALVEQLQATQAALDALQIATDLLQPGETLFHDMRRAVEHLRQEAALRELQAKTEPPMPARQDQDEEGPHIDNRHIYGDLVQSRAQLAEFDGRV